MKYILHIENKDEDIIAGFDSGCDDYVTKPFKINILKAKVNAILERINPINDNLVLEDITYNKMSNLFMINSRELHLTKLEKILLLEFIRNNNKILTREYIIKKLWGDRIVSKSALNVMIKRLKEKLSVVSSSCNYLRSIRGKGYIFIA